MIVIINLLNQILEKELISNCSVLVVSV